MRLVTVLGGTDRGRSGIGAYMRYLLPHLSAQLAARGDELVVLGTARELAAYDDVLHGVSGLAAEGVVPNGVRTERSDRFRVSVRTPSNPVPARD